MTEQGIWLLLLGLAGIGFSQLASRAFTLWRRAVFTKKFLSRFKHYSADYQQGLRQVNQEDYEWLAMRANRMQDELGMGGLVTQIAPMHGYVIHNSRALLETLVDMRTGTANQTPILKCEDMLILTGPHSLYHS